MQSMTGFGRAEHATDHLIARVEIASVNRKQADIVFNLPRELSEIEPALRKSVLEKVSRGRVNVSVNLEAASAAADSLSIDPARAQALEAAFTELSDLLNRPIQPDSHDFLRAPGVFLFK
ncbi:YicC family protein, partial [Akkermansiaceae bacterium]|nr:YicC family protein [Akkermansiaceae bacterium]